MLELLIEHYPNHLGIIKQLKLVCNNLDCSRGSGSPFNDLKAYYQVQGFTDRSRLVQDQEIMSGSRTGWFCSDRRRTEHFEKPRTISDLTVRGSMIKSFTIWAKNLVALNLFENTNISVIEPQKKNQQPQEPGSYFIFFLLRKISKISIDSLTWIRVYYYDLESRFWTVKIFFNPNWLRTGHRNNHCQKWPFQGLNQEW